MEQADLRLWESRCTQEDWTQCQAHCPLHVDVRGFIGQMKAGKYQAARTILERHMPFPILLSHICDHVCEDACLRRELGGSIAIGELERSCIKLADKAGKLLPRPAKNKKIAILGSGLAALTVAWDLSAKSYSVEIFYSEERVEDFLINTLQPLNVANELIQNEFYNLQERGVIFTQKQVDIKLLEHISVQIQSETTEAHTPEWNAIFVDSAYAVDLCPEARSIDNITGSINEQHWLCFGGWLNKNQKANKETLNYKQAYQSVIQAVFEGRRAAVTFDRFLAGASVFASREQESSCHTHLFTNTQGIKAVNSILNRNTHQNHSIETIQAETERCLQCQCLECVNKCAYLQEYKSYPRVYARQIYNNAAIVKGLHQSNSLINSCTLCGQCEELCPEKFSMADLCLITRQEMVTSHKMPPSAHEFALDDMLASNSPECSIVLAAPLRSNQTLNQQCQNLFFPGCQLAAMRSDSVFTVFEHLQNKLQTTHHTKDEKTGVGIFLGCCGIPAHWAGQTTMFQQVLDNFKEKWHSLGQPRLIVACASCLKVFQDHLPQIPSISLWEILNTEAPLPKPNLSINEYNTLCIHDPCTARHNEAWQKSVRELLQSSGVTYLEPKLSAEKTACCGYGGLVWNANPQLATKIALHRAEELSDTHKNPTNVAALVSCIMCRKHLVDAGKETFHILDILLNCSKLDKKIGLEKELGLSARRQERAALKHRILKELYQQSVPEAEKKDFTITLNQALLTQLEKQHILQEDIETVINKVHQGGQSFYDKNTDQFLACLRPIRVTYWVRYSKNQNNYVIHDAYCHRMQIPMAKGNWLNTDRHNSPQG